MRNTIKTILNLLWSYLEKVEGGVTKNVIKVVSIFVIYNFVVKLIANTLFDERISWFFTLQNDFWRSALQFNIPLQGVGALLVAAPVSYYLVRVVPESVRLYAGSVPQTATIDIHDADEFGRHPVIKSLERRIKESSNRANAIITIVIFSLMAAVVIVLFAGRLTSIDATAVSASASIQSDLDNLDTKIKSAEGQVVDSFIPAESKNYLNAQITFLTDRRKQVADLYDAARKIELSHSGEDHFQNTGFFRAALITRVSVLVVLVFLVRILLNLYRYHIQVSAFYASRLDAVRLSSEDLKNMKSMLELVTPEKIQFGPDPQHPFQDLLSALRGKEKPQSAGKSSSS